MACLVEMGNVMLAGMYERMEAIGGTLRIRTNPGRGVTIRAFYRSTRLDQPSELLPGEQKQAEPQNMPEEVRL